MENIKINKALFIVYTPFQGICAINAIKQLEIDDFVFAIHKSFNLRQTQLETLLRKSDIKYIYIDPLSITTFFCKLIKRHNHYDAVFVGDYYYGMSGYAQAALSAGFGAKLFYLDDGASTLAVFSENRRERYSGFVNRLIYMIYEIVLFFKGVGKPYFFTIYDVHSRDFVVLKNEFNGYDTNFVEKKGVYIIGTNASVLPFDGCTYHELLEATYNYVKKHYHDEEVFYCPHGGDPNNKEHILYCETLGMKIFKTEITVEVDFSIMKVNPILVLGYNSTALFTLHKMFPKTDIKNINFQLSDTKLDIEHKEDRKIYEGAGIEIISVY